MKSIIKSFTNRESEERGLMLIEVLFEVHCTYRVSLVHQ